MTEAGTQTRSVIVPVGTVNVQLRAEGDAIARMTQNGKPWEPETRAIWGDLIQQCAAIDMVLDVGAYTGVYSIASALMGMKVTALEPHPANFRRLKTNAAINSVRIEVLPIAASDHNGTQLLRLKKQKENISDTASLDLDTDYSIPVVTRPIDDLRFKTRVGLIKIDVEHHELAVLIGALRTIWEHQPFLIVETLSEIEHRVVQGVMRVLDYRQRNVLDERNRLYGPAT